MSEDTPAPAPVQAGKVRNWQGARVGIVLSVIVVVLAIGVLLVMRHVNHPVSRPPAAAPVPQHTGGPRLIGGRGYKNRVYRAQARRFERRREKAQSSYIRTPTGMFRQVPRKPAAPIAAGARVSHQLPASPQSGPRRPPAGSKELGQLLTAWSRPGGVLTQSLGILPSRQKTSVSLETSRMQQSRLSATQKASSRRAARALPKVRKGSSGVVVIPAGHILYGVTITAINSRVNGPVVCRLVSGVYRGDNLIGSFQDTSNRLVLHFTKLVARHGRSVAIDALAVSPKTGTTFLHGNVDHHYFERFGLLAGAAYLQGYGQAFQNAGTTTVTGSGLAVQSSSASQYATQAALGTMGQTMAQSLSQNANIPATVSLPSGAAMGILFMAPVTRTGGAS